MPLSNSEISAELTEWYRARTRAAVGKSVTISTAAGSRTLTAQDLGEINKMIRQLEQELARPANIGRHNFAVANFNHKKGDY